VAGKVQDFALIEHQTIGAAAGQVDLLDVHDPIVRDRGQVQGQAGRVQSQRVFAVAALGPREGQIADGQDVISRSSSQHIGPTAADQDVVASAAQHHVGCRVPYQIVRRFTATVRDGVQEVLAEEEIAHTGIVVVRLAIRGTNQQVVESVSVAVPTQRQRLARLVRRLDAV